MSRRMIMTGWGLPEYAPAAALLLRCAFKCAAEVMGVSQRNLPQALRDCRETCLEVYVLGIGLGMEPKAIAAELRALKEDGVKVWWISGYAMPPDIAEDFTMKNGESAFERIVIHNGDLLAAVQKAFPKAIANRDVEEFRRYVHGKGNASSDESQYRRLFVAADWKHKTDREMEHYPRAIHSLASGVKYANLGRCLKDVVDCYDKWGNRQLIGHSAHMEEVRRIAQRAAECDDAAVRVLITGPSGTGKETVAQLIHRKSSRADGAFLSFNCACTTESLFECKLFGSVKGAYTDSRDSQGLFEAAANGTLFLDEVGELNYYMQGQLLRVLQDGDYLKVGESIPRRVQNVRVITATNKDLVQLVNEGKFREDLYYRLNVIQIRMKPLAEHAEDIPEIARTIWFRETGGNLGREQRSALAQYDFPGNARELENMLLYAKVMKITDFAKLVEHWKRENMGIRHVNQVEHAEGDERLDAAIARHVRMVAEKYKGHSVKDIARRLGCVENTVRRWLKWRKG